MGGLLLIFTVYCTLRDLVTPFNLFVVFLARAFFHWRKRKRCKWIIIALVKYLDIYGRDFGINIKPPSVYDRTRGDHTVQYTVWHCTITVICSDCLPKLLRHGGETRVRDHPRDGRFGVVLERPCKCKQPGEPL